MVDLSAKKNTTWVSWCNKLLWFAALYGIVSAYAQEGVYNHNIRQNNLVALQNEGFTGNGVQVAFFDAGYRGAQNQAWFQKLVAEGRLKGTFDLVGDSGVYHYSDHGTRVMSIVLGDSSFLGAAPDVDVYLFVTEDVSQEALQEEYNWGRAMHIADSLGVQIINSSLSYTEFDDPRENHSHQDLDGKTAPISQFALEAARRGMLVVSSAGNYGGRSWGKIGCPADADSILSVGAVDITGTITGFSSYGYSADDRVKPEAVALGDSVYHYKASGERVSGNGTSFSAPVITGVAACLWQAFPEANAQQLRQAVIASANQVSTPDSLYGYGIPDAMQAATELQQLLAIEISASWKIYPNPVLPAEEAITIGTSACVGRPCQLTITDLFGKLVYAVQVTGNIRGNSEVQLPARIQEGMYVITLENGLQALGAKKLMIRR